MAVKPQMENICEATKNIKDGTQEPLDSLATTVKAAERLHCMLKDERDEQREDLRITAECIDETANELHTSITKCQNMLKALTPSLDIMQE